MTDIFPGLRQKPAEGPAVAQTPALTFQTEPPRLAAPPIHGVRPRSLVGGVLANSLIVCLLMTIRPAHYTPERKDVFQGVVTLVAPQVRPPAPPRPKPPKTNEARPAGEGAARKASVKRPFVPSPPKPRAAEAVEPPPVVRTPAVEVAGVPAVWPPVPLPPVYRPVVNLDPGQNGTSIQSRPGTRPDGDPLGPGGTGKTGTGHGGCAHGPCGTSAGVTRILDPGAPKTGASGGALPKHTFTPPEILFLPRPAYPLSALRERIEGDVVVRVSFAAKERRVVFLQFVRGLDNAELKALAQRTVEAIRFSPARLDDQEVDSDGQVTFTFRVAQPTNLTASF